MKRWAVPALAVFLAASLSGPRSAQADAKADARRSFKLGMALIDGGQHLEGAGLLEQAYRLAPHPSVLYNIGLAYADGGDYAKAEEFFLRYLDSAPPDQVAVGRLLRLVRQQAAEQSQGATEVPVEGPRATTADPGADGLSAKTAALLARLEALADRLEGREEQPAITEDVLPSDVITHRQDGIYDSLVISASRQETTPTDAPAATTLISADEIRLSGATSVPQLLRRVPGLSTLTMGAGNTNLAIRGFNQRISNKLLTLVDGRSIYQDFLGTTFFHTLPVDIQDIERIEVIRGPGSTLYGASAFGGVVNIITKQPGQEQGGQVHVTGGSGGVLQGNVQLSGRKGIWGFRGSVGYEQAQRYQLEMGSRSDYVPTTEDPELAVRTLRATGAVRLVPQEDAFLQLSGGVSHFYDNIFALGVLRDYWIRGFTSNLRFDLGWKGLAVRAFWNHFLADAAPTWQLEGGLDFSTRPQAHVLDVEASYSGRLVLGFPHDLAVGGGYRLKTIDWNYLDSEHEEQHLMLFFEDRMTFLPQLIGVVGIRLDQHPLAGLQPSPRGAILIKPSPRQSLRISAGTAFRAPTFLESYLDLIIPTGVVTGVGVQSRGSVDLTPENIVSAELGYAFADSDFLEFDVSAYYERVAGLIALGPIAPPSQRLPITQGMFVSGTSTFENAEEVFHGLGLEASIHAYPIDGLDLRGSYSLAVFFDADSLEAGAEDPLDRRHPMHKGHIGASYRAPFGLNAHVGVDLVGAVSVPERSFDTSGDLLVEACKAEPYAMVSARVGYRLLDDRLEFGLSAFNIPAWFHGGHREHCFGTRVGARVLASATYRFGN